MASPGIEDHVEPARLSEDTIGVGRAVRHRRVGDNDARAIVPAVHGASLRVRSEPRVRIALGERRSHYGHRHSVVADHASAKRSD